MIAGGLLFIRSENQAREHAWRHEEAMAAMQARHEAQQKQHEATLAALNVHRRPMETLIKRTSVP